MRVLAYHREVERLNRSGSLKMDSVTMTSRQRVLAALEHREPDRVPVDLGGTIMTGIMAQALSGFLRHIGMPGRSVKVYELYQMLGEVEADLVDSQNLDVLPVEPEALFFGIKRRDYRPWILFDGTKVLMPGSFQVETDESGGWILHEGGDASKPVAAQMPEGGFYFDMAVEESLHLEYEPPELRKMAEEYGVLFREEELDFLAARTEALRPSGKALLFGAWLHFGPPRVGNRTDWLCLMITDPDYVDRLFEIKTEADLRRLEQVEKTLGDAIDIFGIDGADFGTQRSEMFHPELFERYHLPYYTSINTWIHQHTGWKTWKHTCGSVRKLIPYFIESGLDAINPVQTSAEGMEPAELKGEFGDRITFWGGGVDTQRSLPFAEPEQVYREVAQRIRTFGPGGGFVFSAVHNIQAKTPPENIQAMFDAIEDFGTYPIKHL
jgi:hypothetical protein